MQASEVKDRAMISISDATKLGAVDDVLFDQNYQHVLGFLLKEVKMPGSKAATLRANVTAVGPDAITVPSAQALRPAEQFSDLQGARSLSEARGAKVVTEGGELIGTIDGFEVDDAVRDVVACVLAAPLLGRLLGRSSAFSPRHIRQVGEGGRLIVVDNAIGTDEDSAQAATSQGADQPLHG